MMEWTLATLFTVAVLLLILSFVKSMQSAKIANQQIDQIAINFSNEINQLQQKIRNMEIDAEITAQQTGILAGSSEEMLLLREVIDLNKRGYSLKNIAAKYQRSEDEIEVLLGPYMKSKSERSQVIHESPINA